MINEYENPTTFLKGIKTLPLNIFMRKRQSFFVKFTGLKRT
jgi:hypothetical protein